MNFFVKYLFIFSILLLITNMYGQSSGDEVLYQEIEVDPFDYLIIEGAFTVVLRQGKEERLFVESESDIIDFVQVKSSDGTLKVSLNTSIFSSVDFEEIVLFITVDNLNSIDLDGFIELKVEELLDIPNLSLTCKGSVTGTLHIASKSIICDMFSFSKLVILGSCESFVLNKSDASSVDADQLSARSVFVDSSGFGKVDIRVEEELSVVSSGAVILTYSGDPIRKNIDVSGFSTLRQK